MALGSNMMVSGFSSRILFYGSRADLLTLPKMQQARSSKCRREEYRGAFVWCVEKPATLNYDIVLGTLIFAFENKGCSTITIVRHFWAASNNCDERICWMLRTRVDTDGISPIRNDFVGSNHLETFKRGFYGALYSH
jgi:hypothetical protein